MTIRLYCDEDSLRYALVRSLRTRGVDITTTIESEMTGATDEQQLTYATAEQRTIYTYNMGDFCRLHSHWLAERRAHAGIVVARQQHYSVGEQMRRLLKLIGARSAAEMCNRLEFLSDWS